MQKKTTKKGPKKSSKVHRKNEKNEDVGEKKPLNSIPIGKITESKPRKFIPLNDNLAKLINPEEKKRMKKNLEQTLDFLMKIGIVDYKSDEEKMIITVPFEYEEFTFLSHIVISPEWILIKTSIFEIEHLTQSTITDLMFEILKGNFILNGVQYSMDPEHKSIWAQANIRSETDLENFKLNYFSIIFAIDFFMKNISPKLDIQLKSTVDKDKFKEPSSSLYI